MRVFSSFVIAASLLLSPAALAKPGKAVGKTSFAVLYPFAGVQGQQAEASIQRLGGEIAKKGGWSEAPGHLYTRSAAFKQAIAQEGTQPDALLLPLAGYLALKSQHPKWKASYEVSLVSPQQSQFFLVTQDPARKNCDGASVVTHHGDDSPFLTRVVTSGQATLDSVHWVKQRRPIQVLKTLLRGQADCALVDKAQMQAARQLPGGDRLRSIWSSKPLPSMVVVVQNQARGWKKVLGSLCRDASGPVCQEVGLVGFSKLAASRVKSLEALYSAPARTASKKKRR